MKTKRFFVAAMALLMTTMALVTPTFSWYSHNGSADGNTMKYQETNLPVSMKTESGSVSISTKEADANGVETGNAISEGISVPAATVVDSKVKPTVNYYVTTLTNSGDNDVYLDLELSRLPNNASVSIGTTSPVLNQKVYASRAARAKSAYGTTRIYFKSHSDWSSFWGVGNGATDFDSAVGSSNGTTNDMNVAYLPNGVEDVELNVVRKKMSACPTADSDTSGTGTTAVYYCDIPSDAQYFFFFNHWYLRSSSNREWNRTINITNFTPGTLFYLNGQIYDEKYKDYSTRPVDTDLAAVMQKYDSVRMSKNSTADISLKKESESNEEEFNPDYYGDEEKITYASNNKPVCTVNSDGLITAHAPGDATITTTVKGRFGDSIELTTNVTVPENVEQYPIAQNIRVPKRSNAEGAESNEVKIEWYVINKDTTAPATAAGIFFTM